MDLLAHWIANSVNPILAACVVIAPRKTPRPWAFWARCVAGIGVAVLTAEAGKRYQVWPGHPTFPSGHETFALAAGTLLLRHDPRWLVPVLSLVLILAWALVVAHYHVPVDVVGALLTGPPLALLVDRWLTPRRRPDGA